MAARRTGHCLSVCTARGGRPNAPDRCRLVRAPAAIRFDITRWDDADGARRFEGGTPSVAAVYAGRAGLEIVTEIGAQALRERQIEHIRHLVLAAEQAGLHPRVSGPVDRLAGILTIPRANPKAVVAALAEQGVIIDFRPGLIRLSPYFYNTIEDCDRVVQTIAELEQQRIA